MTNKTTTLKITDQILIVGVPCGHSKKHGEVIDASVLFNCERTALVGIVELGIPIRGEEVRLLRGHLGMSVRAFAEELQITHPAVLDWEKQRKKELEISRQIAIRLYIVEKFNLEPRMYSYLTRISRPDVGFFSFQLDKPANPRVCA